MSSKVQHARKHPGLPVGYRPCETVSKRALRLLTCFVAAHLGGGALSNEAEVGITGGHEGQVGANIQAAITEGLAMLAAAAGLMLVLLCGHAAMS